MMFTGRRPRLRTASVCIGACLAALAWGTEARQSRGPGQIGRETAVPSHLRDGEEFKLTPADLIAYGRTLFTANWTEQDGAGRPLTKGNGRRLTDAASPLKDARSFNRVSGPDANSCQGCHNRPDGLAGGSGDFVANAFVLAPRFDFVTFDRKDRVKTRGTQDEADAPATLQSVGNSRATPALFGAGYLEMLARQITRDLQRTRDTLKPGASSPLVSGGISFGTLARRANGRWETSGVEGLPPQSLVTQGGAMPTLVVRPWLQSASGVSLRELTNTSLNQHFGMQSTERFGVNTDPDGDGVRNEITRADVTAMAVFQATLPVPGRVIPTDPEIERAVWTGEQTFERIGCAACHVPSLTLNGNGRIYKEPNPYNLRGNVQGAQTPALSIDLTDGALPFPRLSASDGEPGVVRVPAYTDFKLHDIGDPADQTATEPLDINQPAGSPKFLGGNRRFLTRRLWGAASQPTHYHHGLFTTMREAVLSHAGEALEQKRAFERLAKNEQDAVVRFLGSLQVLPPGTRALVVDQRYQPRTWPPAR